MKPKIHYCHPSITSLEIEYANDASKNGWGDRCYEYIDKLFKIQKILTSKVPIED